MKTDSSILEVESEDPKPNENTRSRYQPHTSTSRKRKYCEDDFENEVLQTLKNSENRHVSFFLKSILPFLEKLDDQQTLTYQSRVMQILSDFNQPTYQYNQPSYSGYQTFQSGYERPQELQQLIKQLAIHHLQASMARLRQIHL